MGVFDDISDFVFGGTDTSQQDLQRAQNLSGKKAIRAGTRRARRDVLDLFPQADINRNLGFQGALDVFGQTIPQQAQVFQAGNVGAQEQLLAGLPEFQAAILGGQLDPNALQATELAFDPSFAQQSLPDFEQPNVRCLSRAPRRRRPKVGGAPLVNQIDPNILSQLLGGSGGGGGERERSGFSGGEFSPSGPGVSIGGGGADIGSLLGGLSNFLDTPEGKIASLIVPGGGIAQILNQLFGGSDPEGFGGGGGSGSGDSTGSGFGKGNDPGGGTPGSPF